MSVTTESGATHGFTADQTNTPLAGIREKAASMRETASENNEEFTELARGQGLAMLNHTGVIDDGQAKAALDAHNPGTDYDAETHEMGQMGAKRIGSLAIGIGVVGIVMNEMSGMEMVNESDGVVDVGSIFETAGSGLNLLVLGVIIAAAAVLLNLWSGF